MAVCGCWAVEGPATTVLYLKTVLLQLNGWTWGPLCTRFSWAPPVLPPPLPVFPTGPREKFSTVTLRLGHKCLGAASLIGLALFVQKDQKEDRMSETISGLGVGHGHRGGNHPLGSASRRRRGREVTSDSLGSERGPPFTSPMRVNEMLRLRCLFHLMIQVGSGCLSEEECG